MIPKSTQLKERLIKERVVKPFLLEFDRNIRCTAFVWLLVLLLLRKLCLYVLLTTAQASESEALPATPLLCEPIKPCIMVFWIGW